MNKNNERDLFLISIFTFITVCFWITFEFLKTIKTTTVSTDVQQLITPLTPSIDTATLEVLKKKSKL
jgi:hypothetical protein